MLAAAPPVRPAVFLPSGQVSGDCTRRWLKNPGTAAGPADDIHRPVKHAGKTGVQPLLVSCCFSCKALYRRLLKALI